VIGRNPVWEALRAGLPVKRAYLAEGVERDDRLRDILAFAANNGISLLRATRQELDRLTGGGVHQGVALQLPSYEYADAQDLLEDALDSEGQAVVVALDSITDPRNLGAIIRSVAAFGAHGVVIPERRSAQVTAAAWKASAGAAARVPVARVTNLNRTLKTYAEAGFQVVGLAGEAEADISAIEADTPILLVVGSEDTGLSHLVRQNCDLLVKIPIASEVESLNASVAAAIALHELARPQ
jgi:23S rRNA (guanosine2251-2'-O)-methyltransferase